MSAKHKELSQQLATWWRAQTHFKTKKALAGFLKVHPDTVGEYFSGKSFPRWDVANKLFELTNIQCLKPADVSTAPGPLEEESLSEKVRRRWPDNRGRGFTQKEAGTQRGRLSFRFKGRAALSVPTRSPGFLVVPIAGNILCGLTCR